MITGGDPYSPAMDGVIVRERIAGHPGVAEIMLDRAEALNAINTEMALRLAQACAELATDKQVRAVVLYGTGERAFCVGADLKERNRMSDADFLRQRPVFRAAFGGLLALPQPVIAAVHGYALGGGCELALCCDVIVADETAGVGLAAALEVEDAAWRTAALSADRREGIAAFNEKRAPKWQGE